MLDMFSASTRRLCEVENEVDRGKIKAIDFGETWSKGTSLTNLYNIEIVLYRPTSFLL